MLGVEEQRTEAAKDWRSIWLRRTVHAPRGSATERKLSGDAPQVSCSSPVRLKYRSSASAAKLNPSNWSSLGTQVRHWASFSQTRSPSSPWEQLKSRRTVSHAWGAPLPIIANLSDLASYNAPGFSSTEPVFGLSAVPMLVTTFGEAETSPFELRGRTTAPLSPGTVRFYLRRNRRDQVRCGALSALARLATSRQSHSHYNLIDPRANAGLGKGRSSD